VSSALRPYRAEDEDAAIALWLRTWQQAYPSIDFAARVPWWRERWTNELVAKASIIVAEQIGELIGFVTIDATGHLDQLVVAPEHWGSDVARLLVDEAKRYRYELRLRPSGCHPSASRCWSTRTMPVRSASMSGAASCLPETTSIRPRAVPC
jgi:GNAT superfamily N-acetyltransferase